MTFRSCVQYQLELEEQIREKKARQERERREREEWEAKQSSDAGYFFSRRSGGGGAPMRDADGNVQLFSTMLTSTDVDSVITRWSYR
jgi:hypothetical protein